MIFRTTSLALGNSKKSDGGFWKKSPRASAKHRDAACIRGISSQMKPKPRVLLLYATSGAGHVRAAQALEKDFLARGDRADALIAALEIVSRLFQQLIDKDYIYSQ